MDILDGSCPISCFAQKAAVDSPCDALNPPSAVVASTKPIGFVDLSVCQSSENTHVRFGKKCAVFGRVYAVDCEHVEDCLCIPLQLGSSIL